MTGSPVQSLPVTNQTADSFDVLLKGGSTAVIRAVLPEDGPAVVAFHGRLSAESIRLRFFGAHPRLSDAEVHRLVHLSGPDGLALVAVRGADLLAIAQYQRAPGSEEAEVAFVVDDALRGEGLATLLLEYLAAAGRRHGIERFVAYTLWENRAMLGVLRDAGFSPQITRDSGQLKVVLDISPRPEAIAAAEERDRQAVVGSMGRLLKPRSIAVVGASRTPGTIGHELVRNLVAGGFNGPVYPVNPAAASVASVPCWPSVEVVPGEVDLAVVAVPAPAVAEVVADCGRKKVGGLVVISAGFAETGAAGAELQRSAVRLAHANGMRMIGPNCFGIVNTDASVSMNATFAADRPIEGAIGFVSQSGGLGIAILAEARARGFGLSSFVSMGNKADVSSNDLLCWWEQDDATKVILLYLESFGNPKKFARIARRVGRSKPIVAMKSGRSSAGTRAASSHSAALASSDDVVGALFRQTGVVRVDTTEELFDVAGVLSDQPLARGRRVAVIGNAGGPGVLAADACAARKLEVPVLSPQLQESLGGLLANSAGLANPVDLMASAGPETYRRCLQLLLESGEVDAAVVIFTPPLGTGVDAVAAAVAEAVDRAAAAGREVPVVAAFIGASSAAGRLRAAGRPVPCFAYPEAAVGALSHAVGYGVWRHRPPGALPALPGVDPNQARRRLLPVTGQGSEWITGPDAAAVLAAYGIACAPTVAVNDPGSAAGAAAGLEPPFALKASGPDLVHKTEAGGVRLDLRSGEEVAAAYQQMAGALGADMTGAVLQPMVKGGVETIVGFVTDPAFGPLVLFGLGGTAVELLGDHASRLAPLTVEDAREMVLGLRGTPLLTGFRGSDPVDVDAVVDVILRMSRLAEDLPELVEADCNPVIVTAAGAVVVDARLRLASTPPVPPDATRHLRVG